MPDKPITRSDACDADAWTQRGVSALQQGRADEALACFAQAAELEPDNAIVWCNWGLALQQTHRLVDARKVLERATTLAPAHGPAWFLLGNACMLLQDWADAGNAFSRALACDPTDMHALRNRAVAQLQCHRLDDARHDCLAVLQQIPNHEPTWRNLGLIERERADLGASLHAYDRALALEPDNAFAHTDRANTLLLMGDYAQGWSAYGWRWHKPAFALPPGLASIPPWTGQDLHGQTLLLHSEQGLGDTLQFCRYAIDLVARGCHVVLAVQPPLVGLLADAFAPRIQVLPVTAALPACDYRCALLDLPARLGATTEPFLGDSGYLRADPQRTVVQAARWQDSPALRVGLVWRGSAQHPNDNRRSLGLATLLAHLPWGPFYLNLQIDTTAAEQLALQARSDIATLEPNDPDWRDTAAAMHNLDLVITVDTSVAHLAGALGVPTWVLLPFAPDWRWQLQRTDSPWYRSLKLFRQTQPGNWHGVLQQVTLALARRMPHAALDAADLVCPVCHLDAQLLDVVDFNTSCEQVRGRHFAPSGIAIYYALCPTCGFCFAPQMRHWTARQWKAHVYNDDYARVDPDHAERRPLANAALLRQLLPTPVRHLDYGGGTGVLAATLAQAGWPSTSWDPLLASAASRPQGRYDLITAFEVVEHAPDPHALLAHWRELLQSGGVVLFSTLLSDGQLAPNQRLTWWYAAPRNGHVSLHSAQSLQRLAQHYGWQYTALSPTLHALHTTIPGWARAWLHPPGDAPA